MAISYTTTVSERAPADQNPISEQGNTTGEPIPVPVGNGWRLISTAVSTNVVYYVWSQGSPVITVTTTPYNAQDGDEIILVDATSGAITVNLATPVDGTQITIKKIDASANTVTIDGNGNTIDGSATQTIGTQYTALKLAADGNNWFMV